MAETREWPLLCADAVVRNILSGAQTQDRRPLFVGRGSSRKPVPTNVLVQYVFNGLVHWDTPVSLRAPSVGDRLWVREKFRPLPDETPPERAKPTRWGIIYAADGAQRLAQAPSGYNPTLYNYERWTPSIHMPRWACRLVLPITRVWVERIQEISEEDAREEGIREVPFRPDDGFPVCVGYTARDGDESTLRTNARDAFRQDLWDQLYPGSWERNDWVLCVEWTTPVIPIARAA